MAVCTYEAPLVNLDGMDNTELPRWSKLGVISSKSTRKDIDLKWCLCKTFLTVVAAYYSYVETQRKHCVRHVRFK